MKVNRLNFDSAVFSSIDTAFNAGGVITSKIHIVGKLNTQSADALGVRWAFGTSALYPREGFRSIDLDAEMEHFRLTLRVDGIPNSLILDSEEAAGFKLVVIGGKKEPKAYVKFHVAYAGNLFELLEFMTSTGATPGRMKLEKRQAEMFTADQLQQEPAPAEVASLCEAPAEGGQTPGQPSQYDDEPFEPEVDAPVVAPSAEPATENSQLQQLARDLQLSPKELRGLDRISPDAGEWRTGDEIRRGIPHHIEPEAVR